MPLRRRTRWALAAGGAVVTLTLALCSYGGWRPVGGGVGVLAAVPGDVDVACRLDAASLRASPLLADPEVASALAGALGLPEGEGLADPLLGDEAAFAQRDGCWLAVVRVAGVAHAARLGVARLLAATSGDGPVLAATLPGDDTVYVARAPGLWIASDDEDLAAEALASASGDVAGIAARGDLGGVFDEPATAALWVSEDASPYAVDAARESLRDAACAVADLLPAPESPFTLRLDADPSARRCDAVLAWRCIAEGTVRRDLVADLATVAAGIEAAAESAPPPRPRVEASDRVRLTIEVSKEGLSGEALRAEVDRRIAERAASRVAADAAAARLAARRKANLLRALAHLDARLDADGGIVDLSLSVGPHHRDARGEDRSDPPARRPR